MSEEGVERRLTRSSLPTLSVNRRSGGTRPDWLMCRHVFPPSLRPWGLSTGSPVEQRGWEEPSGESRFKQGETDMGDKGKKDKGKKEQQKKAQLNQKEKRKQKKEKKKNAQ